MWNLTVKEYNQVANAETLEDAYEAIVDAANIEGVQLPAYKEAIEKKRQRKENRQTEKC